MALGTQVAVGSTFNYAGKLYNRMLEAAREGNFNAAAKEQFRSQQFISCLFKHGRSIIRFWCFFKHLFQSVLPQIFQQLQQTWRYCHFTTPTKSYAVGKLQRCGKSFSFSEKCDKICNFKSVVCLHSRRNETV